MFIGHFGVALAGKKMASKPSLGTLFLAAQFLDLLWPILLVMGIEKVEVEKGNTAFTPLNFVSYPYSHSLLFAVFWAFILGLVYWLMKRDTWSSMVLGVLVLSHWILDLLTHRPDLPLTPWTEAKLGLGLWNIPIATVIVELLIFGFGCYIYLKATEPKNKTGRYSIQLFIAFMLLVYFANIFGPPPESAQVISIVAFTQWIMVAWGYWIDKNRRMRTNLLLQGY
jgi:membrane-bound metal-dependent hydrolase YbcI (DUF457 family)